MAGALGIIPRRLKGNLNVIGLIQKSALLGSAMIIRKSS